MKEKYVTISRCALGTLSRSNWLRKERLDVQDINCGCSDCLKRAKQIEQEHEIKVRVGQPFNN